MNKIWIAFNAIFLIVLVFFLNCKKQELVEPTEPTLGPVERSHIDELPIQKMNFKNGQTVEYKVLLDKPEMVTLLFFLKKGEEISGHYHLVNKAAYIYEGKAEVFAQNKLNPVQKGDTLYIP
ncbi:MAG TPA: hypothetical protein PLS71_06575, partial [Leptospiraceae bacterium]|nr:hypothetical protein [Leptospiraceae bacterium]